MTTPNFKPTETPLLTAKGFLDATQEASDLYVDQVSLEDDVESEKAFEDENNPEDEPWLDDDEPQFESED